MNTTILRKFLDKLFGCKKLSLIAPIVIAITVLVTALVLNGINADTVMQSLAAVLISAVWFFFVYFLIRMFTKLKSCPEWYTDTFELLAFLCFTLSALLQTIDFIKDTKSFSASLCICLISLSAISLAHNKRNQTEK